MLRQFGIQKRLALVLWGSVLLAFLGGGIVLAVYHNLTLEERALGIMQPYARLVSVGTDTAVAFQDPRRAQEILETLKSNAHIMQADIFLADGRRLAGFSRESEPQSHGVPSRQPGVYIEHSRAVLLQTLSHDALLRMSMDLEQINAQTRQIIWVFVVGVLILLGATLGQLAILRRMIVRPISTLTDATEYVRLESDFEHRVPAVGTNEVARLGRSFNAMMEAIQEKQGLLLEAQQIAHFGNWRHDLQSGVVFWSDEIYRILGREPGQVTEATDFTWVHPDDRILLLKAMEEPPTSKGEYSKEFRIIRPDGDVRWVNSSWVRLFDTHGRETERIGTYQDITERKLAEQALQHLNRELRAISECNQILVRAEDEQSLLDSICRIVCEEAGYRMAWVGYAEQDEAKTLRPVVWAGNEEGYLLEGQFTWAEGVRGQGVGGRAIRSGEIQVIDDFKTESKIEIWRDAALQRGYHSSIALPLKDGDHTFGVLCIYADTPGAFPKEEQRLLDELANDLAFGIVTLRTRDERKEAEKKIEHLAFYDLLTDLPNRQLLMDRLHQAMMGSARSQRMGALLFIDLDNFKILNDTCGHDIGDQLLIEVAHRLLTCVREGDTISRLGGDEFVVMLEDLNEKPSEAATQAKVVAEKIITVLNRPYLVAGRQHHSTPSIGVTLFIGSGNSVDELLKQADIAMYQAKTGGRNTLRFFDPDMQAGLAARAEIEADLRLGIQRGEFVLHYQAQVGSERGIIAAEALLRWNHPQRGIVSPADFIPLAEETGLILPIGQWVLECACGQLADWSRDGQKCQLDLAVNVSALQFRQQDFVERVKRALSNSGAPANRLKLELTESLVLDDIEDSNQKMRALKAIGVGFSLDDFGTGYSSLSYLTRLPLDQLKIDSSFIRNLPDSPNDAVVAQAVITLASSLGLGVIAEGVETESQRAFLEQHGCPVYQGYLFAKPMDSAAFEALLATR
jgi:diguanylate cyclase (GGDEF)-like protein/PAS domain S-box-containing protein